MRVDATGIGSVDEVGRPIMDNSPGNPTPCSPVAEVVTDTVLADTTLIASAIFSVVGTLELLCGKLVALADEIAGAGAPAPETIVDPPTADPAPPPADCDDTRVDQLELPGGLTKILLDAGLKTVGQLHRMREKGVSFGTIPKVGKTKDGMIHTALIKFYSEYGDE
jgi:hypothetical protein